MAESEKIQDALSTWVKGNISRRVSTIEEEMLFGGGMSPGMHFIWPQNFDWSVFGFRNDAQVRLIGVKRLWTQYFSQKGRGMEFS